MKDAVFHRAQDLCREGKIRLAGSPCMVYGRLRDFPILATNCIEAEISWALLARFVERGSGNVK